MPASTPARIYLDHNATTPVFPEVVEAMRACWSEPYLNPASQHEFGRRARRVLEDARERIAELVGARTSDRVIFTSGGTESNNLAIRHSIPNRLLRGLIRGELPGIPNWHPNLIISGIEHPSITNLSDQLAQTGYTVDRLAASADGVSSAIDLARLINPKTSLVAVMFANNETGVIQPVADLAEICNKHNVPFHTDASQAAGKLPVNFRELGAATMTIAAHKFGGPMGTGALIVRHHAKVEPQLFGGVQQSGIRPGTESIPLAVGMQVALELWHKNRHEWHAHLESLRNEFESLLKLANCQIEILGEKAERLPNTSNIAFLGLDRQALFVALDQAGVACSTGSACASGSSEPSPTHIAMGCNPAVISSALRFSFGVQTTHAEIAESVERILRICNNLRSGKQS